MPGRLIMEQQGAVGSTDLKKDRSQAQAANLPPKPTFTDHQPAPAVNGSGSHTTTGSLSNGTHVPNAPPPMANGQPDGAMVPPPELDKSWRQAEENKSMGTLIDRLANQCFEDLSNEITKLSEMSSEGQEGQPNGAVPVSDEVSVSKKRSFMEFANGQRDRFIKTLVLSDWARHAGAEMEKLVDLKVWQETQGHAQSRAINFIGVTKHNVGRSKQPNPNIDEALQLLATGKAPSKVPDLGYIPPKRLTAKQLLQTLQGMNVTLATRLNLDEDLPPHFNEFTIANGRATFHVRDEFEIDLSVAEEDPTTPFYFIDFRFAFSPTPGIVDAKLRAILEERTNAVMATYGLKGSYDFLHNFVLTHKINVIRDQARNIHAEKWFGCINAEFKNRVLTLQYWTGRPGRKSWLEFGISTGKSQSKRSRRPPTPQISVRWFRNGELVEDDSITVDWQHVNTEKILSDVILKHTSWLLSQMRDRLLNLVGINSKLELDLATSSTDPEDCSVKLSLPNMRHPLLVRLEPITGSISISPPTPRAAHSERTINRDPNANTSSIIADLLCKIVRDRIGKAAERAGWTALDPRTFRNDNFKKLFGNDLWGWKAYACGKGWGDEWAVVLTTSLSGEKWWVANLQRQPTGPRIFCNARQMSIDSLGVTSRLSKALLLRIQKLAVAEVSFMVLSQQLKALQIPHRIEKLSSLTFEDSSATVESSATVGLFFRGSALFKDTSNRDFKLDSVKVTNQGVLLNTSQDDESAECRQDIQLSVETGQLKHLREYLAAKNAVADIATNASGALALRLRTAFGQPYYEKIVNRLRDCERLDHYLAVIRHYRFECTAASLQNITFVYHRSPELGVSLSFHGGDTGRAPTLRLLPASSNPHQRVRVLLERLNASRSGGRDHFGILCKALCHSIGVLQAFEKVESADGGKQTVEVHSRHPTLFKVAYKAPLTPLIFTIELRERRENGRGIVAWRIQNNKTAQELNSSDAGKAIMGLTRESNKFWNGFPDGTLMAHGSKGALELLCKIDQAMREPSPTPTTVANQQNAPKAAAKPTVAPSQPLQRPAQAPSQQKGPPQKAPPQKNNAPTMPNGPRTMTVGANATPAARNNQPKAKKEIIELD